LFIYFVEQVWLNENTYAHRNFVTEEISHKYWDMYHLTDMYKHVTIYPQPHMEYGVDYIDW
jgi:hypothetical protein